MLLVTDVTESALDAEARVLALRATAPAASGRWPAS